MDNALLRFGVFSATAAIGLYTFKPRALFDDKGQPYPSNLFGSKSPMATPVNWLTASIIIGGFGVLFI
jgi:hypothetical protein